MINNHKTRILFIVPSLCRAGAETQVVNLVNGLDDQLFEKHLLCFEMDLALKPRINNTVNFHHIQRTSKYDISLGKKAGLLINKYSIDLVHCSLQIALLIGWLGIRFSNCKPPLIVALHTTINRNLKAEILELFLYQWLMRSCKKVVCVCESQKRHWENKFPFLEERTQVIYNGVDTDHFSRYQVKEQAEQLRASLDIPQDAKVICHIAGFRPEKGHALLLEAFQAVLDSFKNVYLIFAGDGILHLQIMELVEQMSLTGNVRFLGAVSDVRPLLTISDLSVISSTAVETFSIAMLEAMSMEVPLVAVDIGGMSEAVITGKTGYLVPAKNPQALCQRLLDALNNDQQRKLFGLQARQYIVERLSSQLMIKQTERLIFDSVGK